MNRHSLGSAVKRTLLLFAVCLSVLRAAIADSSIVPPFEEERGSLAPNRLDAAVLTQLREQGILPAKPSSDEVFVRRVYLDAIGTLPELEEVRAFLEDENPDKRSALIDALLERPEFTDYWTLKWGDLLRVKAEFPINLWPNAVQAYARWIRNAIRENRPYDQFVRELLTSSGSNFRVGPVNFYRAIQGRKPEDIAAAVALTFMGTRLENWPEARRAEMAVFFSRLIFKSTTEWKEEIVCLDPAPAEALSAVFPDGRSVSISPDQDPREVFADWLISRDNPWFARSIVNRIWAWLMGRGIVHEPDDIRPDNPPSNPELLAFLEKELVGAKYDLKHVYRLILNSKIYQLSSIPRSKKPEAAVHFAQYPLRRLEAEVLIDALNQITGTTESYTSAIPEPFTFIPEGQRSITLPDGSITSSFLEQFGRPSRDGGLESERSNRPTPDQRLHMLNSSHIQRKIEQSDKIRELVSTSQSAPEAASRIYLTILARLPTESELRIIDKYAKSDVVRGQEALTDLIWALINSVEFQYRH